MMHEMFFIIFFNTRCLYHAKNKKKTPKEFRFTWNMEIHKETCLSVVANCLVLVFVQLNFTRKTMLSKSTVMKKTS